MLVPEIMLNDIKWKSKEKKMNAYSTQEAPVQIPHGAVDAERKKQKKEKRRTKKQTTAAQTHKTNQMEVRVL